MKFFGYIDSNKETINESINDKGIFKTVFMSGNPGAGKSYVLTKIKSGNIEPRVVNVDKFTEFLDIHNIYTVYDRAKQLTLNQLAQFLNGALPLFVDMTGCNIGRIKNRVDALEQLGYDVGMVFINTSLETSLLRAEKRVRKVPPAVVKDYYEKMIKVKNGVKELFSFSIEINNDEGELTDEVVLKAYKRISYFYDAPIENPIGKEYFEKMKETGSKYLHPEVVNISDIHRITDNWFRK